MKDLNGLLATIKEELDKDYIVSIFLSDLMSQHEMYAKPNLIDYTKFGFSKETILDAIEELADTGKITIIDSGNMGYWIESPDQHVGDEES